MNHTLVKAELLIESKINVSCRLPVPYIRSAAGPYTNTKALVLNFNDKFVKLEVVKNNNCKYKLVEDGQTYKILKYDKPYVENIILPKVIFHSPNEAFFNIQPECNYACKFCKHTSINYTLNSPPEILKNYYQEGIIKSISITSGIKNSISQTVSKITDFVIKVRRMLPTIPIGVETYVNSYEQIRTLKDVGAEEFKLNYHCNKNGIFPENIHPKKMLKFLKYSVKVFSKGKVCSNVFLNIDSLKDTLNNIKLLAKIGVAGYLRLVRGDIDFVRHIEVKDWLYAVQMQKKYFAYYGLSTKTFRTMCFRCGCCDILPEVDV